MVEFIGEALGGLILQMSDSLDPLSLLLFRAAHIKLPSAKNEMNYLVSKRLIRHFTLP